MRMFENGLVDGYSNSPLTKKEKGQRILVDWQSICIYRGLSYGFRFS